MSAQAPAGLPPELLSQLAELADDSSRQEFLRAHPQLQECSMILRITEEVVRAARENVEHAERLAKVATWLSEVLNDNFCRARSARAAGHLLSIKGKHHDALKSYEKATGLFDRLSEEIESAITLSGSLQPLILLGRYEEAFRRAEKARGIFKRHGDRLRLARLDANLANILHRQDRFGDALVLYRRAQQTLEEFGQHRDVAVVLANSAVCCISLYDFASALAAYQQARHYCERHNMPLLAAQADYNIAYLYFLRGEYPRAIELYQASRAFCDKVGDTYHRALCDLDESEIYLELNLPQEAELLAQRAFAHFEKTQMGYEVAKALAFLGIAADQQRKPFRALELFVQARERFKNEQNWVWPALLDLYSALVLYHEGRAYEARRSCDAALDLLSHSSLKGKAAVAQLLRAALHREAGEFTDAEYWCDAVLQRLGPDGAPALRYLAFFVRGLIYESRHQVAAAHRAYQESLEALESVPFQRQAEELKIPFLKEKLALYDALITSSLALPADANMKEEALTVMEKAKSRQLADLVAFRAHVLPAATASRSGLVEQVKSRREELNWYYRQIDLQELRQEQESESKTGRLRHSAREHEVQLLKALAELQGSDEEFLSLQNGRIVGLDAIRQALPENTKLVEYHIARGTVLAVVADRSTLEIMALTPASRVRTLLRQLQEEFAKFRLGPEYVESFSKPMCSAALRHLHALYSQLFAPLRQWCTASPAANGALPRLVIVPHSFLHYLPFHALWDGEKFLTEPFAISYAGSANVYYLCLTKTLEIEDRSLVLDVSTGAGAGAGKAEPSVAGVLRNVRILRGTDASAAALREQAPGSRFVHLATRADYRHDNPLFSSLYLGDGPISVFDLYHLRLPCALLTLAGCAPGLNPTGDGEELTGLVRGLLYAGAQAVLTNIWDVPGPATPLLLQAFYRQAQGSADLSVALRSAMLTVRQFYPHPYYWAPFTLMGKTTLPN